MKKLLLFSIIAMIGITASAAALTMEQYVVKRTAELEKAGKPFDKAKVEAEFYKKDLNKDGVLDAEDTKLKKEKAK